MGVDEFGPERRAGDGTAVGESNVFKASEAEIGSCIVAMKVFPLVVSRMS